MLAAGRSREKDKQGALDLATQAHARGSSLTMAIVDLSREGAVAPSNHWVRAAEARIRKGEAITKKQPRGAHLKSLEKELSRVEAQGLPAHMRGKLAAVKKSTQQMKEEAGKGRLDVDAERVGVSRAAAGAFDILGGDAKGKKFFDISANAADDRTREGLSKSFKRGLVSDVAAEKGKGWEQSARGLASLGMIGSADPRLKAASAERSRATAPDRDHVDSGTAKTSVEQIGRSLNDVSATIGNRMNSAGGTDKEPNGAKDPFGSAAKKEMEGLKLSGSSASKSQAATLFSSAARDADSGHGVIFDAIMGKKKKRDREAR